RIRAVHARDGAGDVRAVVLERLRRERPRLPGEVDARDDHLLAGELLVARIELGEPRWRRERVVGEERMGLVDAGVEYADFDARARVRDSPDRSPSGGRVDH